MPKQITADEWRAELERALGRSSDEGMTSEEIGESLGLSVRTAMSRLKALARAGRLGVGKRATVALHGRASWSPVYFVKPSSNGKDPVERKPK